MTKIVLVASVGVIVALEPATALVNPLNVKLAFALNLKILPVDISGLILVLVFVLAGNVSLNLVIAMLPIVAVPDIDTLVNVPTLVILGCAAVVTVPAVVALVALVALVAVVAVVALVANATAPETLAPATELATAAKLT